MAGDLVVLAVIAAAEGAVHQCRYASATRACPVRAAAWTGGVCVLRVLFVWTGVASAIDGRPLWAVVAAYVAPAMLTAALAHTVGGHGRGGVNGTTDGPGVGGVAPPGCPGVTREEAGDAR